MLHAAVVPSLPASAVTHSLVGRFSDGISEELRELVVFKKNNMELWRTAHDKLGNTRMSFVMSTQLNAPPASVSLCRPPGFTVDIIAMCFDDFHVSFVQYDPMLMRFHTVLLVQLDDREVVQDASALDPLMRVDATGRFVAVLVRRRHLFLIPLLGPLQVSDAGCDAAATPGDRCGVGPGDGGDCSDRNGMTKALADDWGDEGDYVDERLAESKEGEEESRTTPADVEGNGKFASSEPHNSKVVSISSVLLRVGTISMFTLSTTVKSSIRYVRDLQFIGSSGEPLLAILCERQPTWAGRVKLVEWRTKVVESNTLTMHVTWVQISASMTAHPKLLLIGEVEGVPYNVTHMLPVEPFSQTMSGVVCFGTNVIMHITTKRGYGAYFNDTGREECINSKFSAVSFGKAVWSDPQLDKSSALARVNMSLANCAATSMVGKMGDELQVLALLEEDGVVITLHFVARGSSVEEVRITMLGSGCYCSSVSRIGRQLVFLGSTVGDSYVAVVDPLHHDPAMRLQIVECMEAIGAILDADAVDCTTNAEAGSEDGSEENPAAASSTSWLDGTPFKELEDKTALDRMPDTPLVMYRSVRDLAACAGHGATGCVYVLRQSVRGQVVQHENVNAVSVFFLESVQNSKRAREEEVDGEKASEAQDEVNPGPGAVFLPHVLLTGHSFTIVSVVRGRSMQHVRHSEFVTSCRTIFAVSLVQLSALLQLTEREGRIISQNGKKLLQRFSFIGERELEDGHNAKSAHFAEELGLLFVLLHNGTLLRFTLLSTDAAPDKERFADDVVAFALWRERKSLVMFMTDRSMVVRDMQSDAVHATFPLLGTLPPYSVLGVPIEEVAQDAFADETLPRVTHTEVLTLREATAPSRSTTNNAVISTALLVVLSTGELSVYRVMESDSFGPLRLIKMFNHFLDNKVIRDTIESIEAKKSRLEQERAMIESETQLTRHCSRSIIPFDSLAGNVGAYVCGRHPLFLLWDRRTGLLSGYRHQIQGPVRGFAPFPLMEGGFVYCGEGFTDFAVMNTYCRPIGHGWLGRRIDVGATPHFISYNMPGRGCFVVTSHKQPFRPQRAPFDVQLKISYNEETGAIQSIATEPLTCSMPPIASSAGVRVPMADWFEVRFMSTAHVDWPCEDTFKLEENERVLSIQMVQIDGDRGMKINGTVPVCVVSTAFPLGDDVTCRGRIHLLATKSLRRGHKIVHLHAEALNGPATAVAEIRHHIAVAVGGTIKIYRYDWQSGKLVVSVLLYAGIYATKLSVIRNYIVYGDLIHSCAMARFNEENHTLTVLGRNRNSISVVDCNMMYHDRSFGILCSDDQRNVLVMGYTPRVQEAGAGRPAKTLESLLTLDGEYRLPSGCLAKSLRFSSDFGNSSVMLYTSNYGEVGFIVPIGEQANRTALWVTRRLQTDVPCDAGLTPRMFLGLSQGSPRTALRAKEMLISFPVLQRLYSVDLHARKVIARAAYTQLDRITNVVVLVLNECYLF
ncbi:Mono functional DNA alkylating methyl methanesulfonate N term CPSF A subunit region [Trypanosoma vivax]|uniref:Putative mitochondrial carrier protein n=1 Tax=Trypanosoma vivax (strain Y486) TaxID=1055687 RepID=G0U8W4_TRYVY|nr:putative carrier protein [Trypanosoma vivax]KAH8603407.1 Mono functional DNA alkylating methyl methanesulfonate N term CPSF A subunit region [Trypanosoma vivax]CCC54046.1 putative mitochondrial carrier protein [Trypanosoma vivax Y486]